MPSRQVGAASLVVEVVGSSAVGVLGCVVLIGATAQTVPGEITANRVVIVDDAGKPRIVLGKGKDGKDDRYEISLANEKGVPRSAVRI